MESMPLSEVPLVSRPATAFVVGPREHSWAPAAVPEKYQGRVPQISSEPRHAGRAAGVSTSALLAAAAVAGGAAARQMRGQRKAKKVARMVSTLEKNSLEAGARLLEEAVKASQTETNPTKFNFQSLEKNRVSYVSQQAAAEGITDINAVDEDGLPLIYSVDRIAKYWDLKPGELADRWSRFLRISTPFITRFFYSLLNNRLWEDERSLARQAVDNMTELGPTFVKLGQVLSIRPDVLPPVTMSELSRLQDNIKPFSTKEARATIEKELGKPISELFSSISDEPIAAASLAQVYRATLKSTGEEVAVKVQRPGALGTVSKDLYVLRRLADVIQPLIRRFTADETDYIALCETFAEGLYTELDFRNEALNAIRMEELLKENASNKALERVIIARPILEYTSRRVMLSKWINGVKLSSLPQHEIKELISVGQEVFLTQLLDMGFFHGDPHPGNLLKVVEGPDAGKLCLLDFGLVAEVPKQDREIIVNSVVHLGTQNWEGLIDDFQKLGFLSQDTDRGVLIPILQRILGPYLKGGGASAMKTMNFQALSQDLLKVNLEVKFSIPPYVSLLARSVATLEGVALQGDPQYQIVGQAYPFVVRKLLKNDSRSSFKVLRELLYDPESQRLRPQRLSTMLQASLGVVAEASSTAGFIDFDTAPEDGAPLSEVVKFLLSENATNLRPLLNAELSYGLDLILRRSGRLLRTQIREALIPRIPILGIRLPAPPRPPVIVLVPTNIDDLSKEASFRLMQTDEIFDACLPELTPSDDVDLRTFNEAAQGAFFGGAEPEISPTALFSIVSSIVTSRGGSSSEGPDSDSGAPVKELAEVLSSFVRERHLRRVLTSEVILAVSREILRTWRARLAVAARSL